MKRIGLISDTHGFLDESIFNYFKEVDEVWHCGDFSTPGIIDRLKSFKPLRGVWGNVDDAAIRMEFPEVASFKIEDVGVLMLHIGGYPGRYTPKAKTELTMHGPQLFISGHSHILKVMYDDTIQCLHINPGAAGQHGWHTMRTIMRFTIDGTKIQQCEVIELGKRGALVNR